MNIKIMVLNEVMVTLD